MANEMTNEMAKGATVGTVLLQTAGGRRIRKATYVTFADGRVVNFIERLGKREAIRQAIEIRTKDDARHAAEVAESNAAIVTKVLGRDVTRGELLAAFNRVAPAADWKMPIDAVVDCANDVEKFSILEAVTFFTGSVATMNVVSGGTFPGCRYRVQAAGYYAAVGA